MTEVGFEFPFKKALLARYRADAVLPPAQMEALLSNEELMRSGIWLEEAQKPMSFEPFSEEERRAVSTGNFCNFHRRPQQAAGPGKHHQQPHQQQQRNHAPAEPNQDEDDYFSRRQRPAWLEQDTRNKGKSIMSTTRRKELESDRTFDKALEERFNAPLNTRKGIAPEHIGGVVPHRVVQSLSDLEEDGDPLVSWAEKQETKGISMERGPSGRQIESAFYSSQYHQETVTSSQQHVPDQPSVFAQFMSNFQPQAPPAPRAARPTITASTQWLYRDPSGAIQGPFTNSKMQEWYTRNFFPETLPLRRNDDAEFETLAVWKARFGGQPPFELAYSAPAAAPVGGSAQLQPSSSPLAGLFDLNLSLSQPGSPAPKALSEEESRFLAQLGLMSPKPSKPQQPTAEQVQTQPGSARLDKPAPAQPAAPVQPVAPIAPAQLEKPATSPWGSVPKAQPINLDDQPPKPSKKASPASQPIPTEKTERPLVSAASAGWCKPASPPPARPLEEILAEEERKVAARPKASAASAPKSFADLMKASGATSQPSAPQPTSQSRPASGPAYSGPSAAAAPKQAATVHGQSSAQWATTALRPLAGQYDLDTVVSLLMSCPTADETAAFVRANLRTDRINTATFLQELVQRRFGPQEAARFAPKPEGDDEFVTVDRRRK